ARVAFGPGASELSIAFTSDEGETVLRLTPAPAAGGEAHAVLTLQPPRGGGRGPARPDGAAPGGGRAARAGRPLGPRGRTPRRRHRPGAGPRRRPAARALRRRRRVGARGPRRTWP